MLNSLTYADMEFKIGDKIRLGNGIEAQISGMRRETRIGLQFEGRRILSYILEVDSLPDNTELITQDNGDCTESDREPETEEG